jgi:carboxyl-terminal processing protease
MQRIYVFLLMIAVLFFGLFFGYKFAGKYTIGLGSGGSGAEKLSEAYSVIKNNYVDQLESEELTVEAIQGMLNSLDPHSTYLSAEQVRMAMEEFQGNFEGIGVEFDIVNDTLIVVAPISGGPSEALGILAGDRIIEIDDSSAIGITTMEVIKQLRGKKGTTVQVDILRPGESQIYTFNIKRDKIPTFSIDLVMMLDETTGYIKLSKFVESSHEEFLEALSQLKSEGLENLILDLRGNPGGLLSQAVLIADEFIQGGKKIVFTRSRISNMQQTEFAQPNGKYEEGGLVVLVDKGSASASEIVSGAIQDHDRALIVGERTFGKGLVQRQYSLSDGSALRVTVSRYYSPLGRKIQRDYKAGSKGRTEYYSEVFHRGEDKKKLNGESDTLLDASSEIEADTTNQVFTTVSGRKIFGGGGIVPDYVIKSDTLAPYTRMLRKNRLFSEFAMQYLAAKGSMLRDRFGEDYIKFVREYRISPRDVELVLDLAQENDIPFIQKDFQKDKETIGVIIKSKLARQLWGFKGEIATLTEIDRVLIKAQTLFEESRKLGMK